jgi:acetoacetate decarboxylase
MGFVRTPEEIGRIQEALSKPRFVGAEMLTVDFLTTPGFVEAVLPPGLEPAGQPRITTMVGRWRSNCVADFDGGAIYVAARHGDLDGDYVLAMFMDDDEPIIFGRDLFGEPKKQAVSQLHRRGDRMTGYIERRGTRPMQLDAELTEDTGPVRGTGHNFNYKATPSADGLGLEHDAVLTVATFENDFWTSRGGTGEVQLTSTVHDPLGEIPIESVLGASYVEGDMIASCRSAIRIPAEDFLPYALGRLDDWSALNTESPRALVAS